MNPFTNVRRIFYYVGVMFLTMEYLVQWACTEPVGRDGKSSAATSSIVSSISYTIDTGDDYAIQQLAVIVDALENLNILDGNKKSCYMVDKITKLSEYVDSNTQKIGLAFYVSQPSLDSVKPPTQSLNDSTGVTDLSPAQYNKTQLKPACGRDGGGVISVYKGDKADNNNNVTDSIKTLNVTTSNETIAQQGGQGGATAADSTNRNQEIEDDMRGKLSHTQIMVISTCSSVIGLFFIVALIMRVRNYLKRKSDSSGKRSGLTSSSMAFRSSSHSPARTDSIASKCGLPDSTSSIPVPNAHTNGSSFPKNSSSLVAPDNKPLLVITSASAPSSPLGHLGFGMHHKHKVSHTPSAPAASNSSNKDYLTIHSRRYQPSTTGKPMQTNHAPVTYISNSRQHTPLTSATKNRHAPLTKQRPPPLSLARPSHHGSPPYIPEPSPASSKLHFSEYYRDSNKCSSESSLSGTEKTTETAINSSGKPHSDSCTSNQSGYESSANTTDSSMTFPQVDKSAGTKLSNVAGTNLANIAETNLSDFTACILPNGRCNSDDVFEEATESSDHRSIQIPSILTIRKEIPQPEQQQSSSSPREKRSSSSSSYGRKSVSFSIDIDHRHSSSSDIEESVEDLLLRPEFLGMEPTYV